jgi:hypothetical protein
MSDFPNDPDDAVAMCYTHLAAINSYGGVADAHAHGHEKVCRCPTEIIVESLERFWQNSAIPHCNIIMKNL